MPYQLGYSPITCDMQENYNITDKEISSVIPYILCNFMIKLHVNKYNFSYLSNTNYERMINMEENLNVLDELNKGATMGMDAIKYVLEKVEDDGFKKVLENQYSDYEAVSNKVGEIYSKYSSKEPHETNAANKVMTWYGIQMKTFVDKSNSKIAELLLQGTNMGIIEGRKMLNNKKVDDEIHRLLEAFVNMQEEWVEQLKKYL